MIIYFSGKGGTLNIPFIVIEIDNCNCLNRLIKSVECYMYFRLFELTYNRSIKPWFYMERIYSLTENAKQMRSGLKIVQNFIHNVRKFYNFYIYIIRYI